MEILSIADVVTTLSTSSSQGSLGFDKSFPSVTRALSISAGISVDTIERPRIIYNRCRSIPRSFTTKKRRTRKRSQTGGGDDSDDGGEGNSFFGDGNEGPFGGGGSFGGGGGGGGGGRGWNSDGYGGSDWDDDSSSSPSDPAFDNVVKVLSWIMLSNCSLFAFKKVLRIIADGAIGDPTREKVVPVC